MTYLVNGALTVVLIVSIFSAAGSIFAVFVGFVESASWREATVFVGAALVAAVLFASAASWAAGTMTERGAW